ncbi:hypothetical protein DPMN_190676 [Dreissena polymorpha]|uniref:Uncharacterized protein n=1 Tax=Dreissena polymorpha TaxID=45954 RepID=A0A9D3XYH9_DREPO|nr:hypothetical protein DPMN_190676 [Dreissena polymorpha]
MTTTSRYMSALAVVDILVLLIPAGDVSLKFVMDMRLEAAAAYNDGDDDHDDGDDDDNDHDNGDDDANDDDYRKRFL